MEAIRGRCVAGDVAPPSLTERLWLCILWHCFVAEVLGVFSSRAIRSSWRPGDRPSEDEVQCALLQRTPRMRGASQNQKLFFRLSRIFGGRLDRSGELELQEFESSRGNELAKSRKAGYAAGVTRARARSLGHRRPRLLARVARVTQPKGVMLHHPTLAQSETDRRGTT